jgi:REP element-mobilizing transposase RayT
MSYHPRIESPELANFLTTRTRNSELWFVNNQSLEESILGYAAKYAERYGVKLYALAIEGNHIQGPALFPEGNRSSFMRDLNSSIARAVPRETRHPGGHLWARRYSNEFLPRDEDVEKYFFYTVLQPVQDGLVEHISDYPGYNCFQDAIWGRAREFKVVRWAEYNAAKRWKRPVAIEAYTDIVKLRFERLPGHEDLSQEDYAQLMTRKLESYRTEALAKRGDKGFLGRERLKLVRPGSVPKSTKTSTIHSHRPRVLSDCPAKRQECEAWYFDIHFKYKECSQSYRKGDRTVIFPQGTYPPHLPPRQSDKIE